MSIRAFLVFLPSLCAIILVASQAVAECKVDGPSSMYLGKNEAYQLFVVVQRDGLCPVFFKAQATGVNFSSSEIIVPPTRGRIAPAGPNKFAYVAPKAVGADAFVLKVCGTDAAGNGCNRLEYNVEVK